MATTSLGTTTSYSEDAARRASAKAFRRLTWFLVLCYLVSQLDRINIGYAALTMGADLGLTATTFGIATSIFYVGYAGLEVPSSMALAKYGARRWIPRIMFTWGIATALTVFAVGPYSLYFLRFLVGAAEAGLLPGVMLYLSYWFTQRDRARANGLFVLGMPLGSLVGAPICGYILTMDGTADLQGWQWLFLLTGLPSIVLAVFGLYYLVDRPAKAKWLTEEERTALEAALESERGHAPAEKGHQKFQWRELANVTIALLAVAYFCNVANNNTLNLWTPLVVKEVLGGTDDVVRIALVSAIMPLCTLVALPLWTWNSDRTQERVLHLSACLALAAVGWIMMALLDSPTLKLVGLTFTYLGGYAFIPLFWALAAPMLSPATRPAAFGLIATIGLIASIISPSVIGVLRDVTASFTAGFWYVAALQVVGLIAMALAQRKRRPAAPTAS